jgi:hypothetical protein
LKEATRLVTVENDPLKKDERRNNLKIIQQKYFEQEKQLNALEQEYEILKQ